MKAIIQDSRRFLLRFDKDEEVFSCLLKFIKEQGIGACVFFGIGAASAVELGFFNPFLKSYRKKPFVEELEIVSITGNAGLSENEPVMHAHGSFGRNDFSLIGGHVFKLTVGITCEIFLLKLDGALQRAKNEEFDLDLLV